MFSTQLFESLYVIESLKTFATHVDVTPVF